MSGVYSAVLRELPQTAVTRPGDEDQAFEATDCLRPRDVRDEPTRRSPRE